MSAPEDQVRQQAGGVALAAPAAGFSRDTVIRLAVLAIGMVALLGTYRDTLASMVAIWNRSDTFAHGYLVAPITCWLIWRERERLRGLPLTHSLLGMAAAAAAGFAWLLGELASVASVSQFAFVGMVVALVWAVMGTRVARALAFPLGFLFFLVPFGEFLFPSMMDRTTDFIIWGLRASGVPVYAEGRSLVIPSGHWEVVEGCSGVRYLIASVVVGSLYAYLTYCSLGRRLVFVGLSIILPILANWMRAYGIVLLAHVSDNRIAAGVDHLIYGWVFFGLVMLGLFWLGTRWREDETPLDATQHAVAPAMPVSRSTRFTSVAWAVGALSAAIVWVLVPGFLSAQGPQGAVRMSALDGRGGWGPAADRLPVWSPRYSGMQEELRGVWAAGDLTVGVYMAYYRNQGAGTELINSENRILRNKDPDWTMATYANRETQIGSQVISVRSTEIYKGDRRLLVWNWYWVDGRWTSSDYVAKLYQVVSLLSGRGDDAAAVMLYAPIVGGRRDEAAGALHAFAREMGPGIGALLDQVRGNHGGRQ